MHERRLAFDFIELSSAVKVDDLAKKSDFFNATVTELDDFVDNVSNGSATLAATCIRNNAVGALHVTALHDADKGGDLTRVTSMRLNGVLRIRFFLEIDDRSGPWALPLHRRDDIRQMIGDPVKFLRAEDEIEVRQAIE